MPLVETDRLLQDDVMSDGKSGEQVNLVLTPDEALVLFEWLSRLNAAENEFADQAERRVLRDLESNVGIRRSWRP